MIKTTKDHLGRLIEYEYPPKRIISLCPGITDTVYSLQLENEIVGRTKYCIHPEEKVRNAAIVGGTKKVKLDVIHELKPDLILAEKEENTKEMVEELEKHYPVFVAEVQSVDEAYRMIHDIGAVTDRAEIADRLVNTITSQFQFLPNVQGKRAAYVIWRKPYMVVGKDTYINSLLERIGFVNPFTASEGRYPSVSKEDFLQANLDYLLLASEPFPFQEKHQMEFAEFLQNIPSILVDGEMFWYGPRMLEAAKYFKKTFETIN
ncbi:helical backbone metal receptor [Heyndrickxia sporothermodurans]|uniref:ABC transporter substrate-binding protein n=1 Tax=Heyndrickxia sporothermodurans TaxID=46224 RepID=UPI001F39ADE6|nr:helical backbone metal receptor [Heyndrickxia sporothermodurans]MEB6550816.1 helical backbone metal receptor [Heyndrickxia sporothermodurans]MED3652254.1 helical backbone metal receptor [Heyndrickxia sporothermodurans]MED3655529.1 helical backbone metal receptor [Heyndrickxia sporothermodurans]MED3696835.1 helical backbone metal receptor [Heyndrickxia sporothermodurans]MED3782648.1 helical backbone metal receptor [Heyndrickxia sporothermodurans]